MIIGSKEELMELGRTLMNSVTNTPVDPKVWPPKVADFKPLSVDGEFNVSFHIATTVEIPETNFPDRINSGGKAGIFAKIARWLKT